MSIDQIPTASADLDDRTSGRQHDLEDLDAGDRIMSHGFAHDIGGDAAKHCTNALTTVDAFLDRLMTPEANRHNKAGSIFTQFTIGDGSTNYDGPRGNGYIHTLELVAYDIDHATDEQIDDLIDHIDGLGIKAAIVETHSSRRTVEKIAAADVAAWLEKTGQRDVLNAGDVTVDECVAYWSKTAPDDVAQVTGCKRDGDIFVLDHVPAKRWRAVFPIAVPVKADTIAPIEDWPDLWPAFLSRLADRLGLAKLYDVACTDPGRAFYFTRRPRGTDFIGHRFDGDLVDVVPLLREVAADPVWRKARTLSTKAHSLRTAAVDGSDEYGYPGLKPFAANFGTRMAVADWLEARGVEYKDDGAGRSFLCAHDDRHGTTRGELKLWAVNGDPATATSFVLKCHSASCNEAQKAEAIKHGCDAEAWHSDRLYFLAAYMTAFDLASIEDLFEEPALIFDVADDEREAFLVKHGPAPTREAINKLVDGLGDKATSDGVGRILQLMARYIVKAKNEAVATLDVERWLATLKPIAKLPMGTLRSTLASLTTTAKKATNKDKAKAPAPFGDGRRRFTCEDDFIEYMNDRFVMVDTGTRHSIYIRPHIRKDGRKAAGRFKDHKSFVATSLGKHGVLWYGDAIGQDAVTAWMTHPRRALADEVVFDPSERYAGDGINLWEGFDIEAAPGDYSLLRRHLLHGLCGGDLEVAIYAFTWHVDLIQNATSNRPGVVMAVRGEEGAGKSLWASTVADLMQSSAAVINKKSQLVGNFNSLLANKRYIRMEEAVFADDRAAIASFKDIADNTRIAIEQKFMDPIMQDATFRICMNGNPEKLIDAGGRSRRWFVLEADESRINDFNYFTAILDQNKAGGLAGFLWDLCRARVPADLILRKVPTTAALREQRKLSLDPLDEIIFGIMENGGLAYVDAINNKAWAEHTSTTMFDADVEDKTRFATYSSALSHQTTRRNAYVEMKERAGDKMGKTFAGDGVGGPQIKVGYTDSGDLVVPADTLRAVYDKYRERYPLTPHSFNKKLAKWGIHQVKARARGKYLGLVYVIPPVEILEENAEAVARVSEKSAKDAGPVCALSDNDRAIWLAWFEGEGPPPWESEDYTGDLVDYYPERSPLRDKWIATPDKASDDESDEN